MSKLNLAIVGVLLIAVSLSCKCSSRSTNTSKAPAVDVTKPGKGLDAKVQLDKKQTATGKYRVLGQSSNVTFAGEICRLDMPFVLNATFPGGSAKTSFSPSSAAEGSTAVSGGGGGCKQSGGGNYTVTTKEDGSETITWTTTDRLACPGFSNSRTATFTLPLQPAPDLVCP